MLPDMWRNFCQKFTVHLDIFWNNLAENKSFVVKLSGNCCFSRKFFKSLLILHTKTPHTFKQRVSKMEATMDVKTRGQKKMIGQPLLDDPKAILNNIGENQAEAQELVEDRIFHDFVEVTFQIFTIFNLKSILGILEVIYLQNLPISTHCCTYWV